MILFFSPPSDINLANEPKPHRSKTAKRAAGDMYRFLTYVYLYVRMYSYQARVPPLPPPPLSRAVVPSKRPRVSLISRLVSRSHSFTLLSDDLQAIKRELTQIKHKVDYLLESLERMEKDHGKKSGEDQ
uniref:RALY RNA binding protein like n=1 Tax=Labrus bergylta TaxID=56723 RepID=A0A3Q3GGW4_9LABR